MQNVVSAFLRKVDTSDSFEILAHNVWLSQFIQKHSAKDRRRLMLSLEEEELLP